MHLASIPDDVIMLTSQRFKGFPMLRANRVTTYNKGLETISQSSELTVERRGLQSRLK